MNIYDIHLIQDEGADITLMPTNLQDTLTELFVEYPSAIALGTRPINGRIVIHARIQYATAITENILIGMFTLFGLNWEVLGIRAAYETQATINDLGDIIIPAFYSEIKRIDKSSLLPYLNQIPIDLTSTPVTYRDVTISDSVILPMYAGTEPIML